MEASPNPFSDAKPNAKTRKALKASSKAARAKKAKKPKKPKKSARNALRVERMDLRLTKAEKAKLYAKANASRRTVTSIISEMIERLK